MINFHELKRWRDFTETIPAEMIAMESWRQGSSLTPKCDSIGCIVGHCTALYTIEQLPKDILGRINFMEVSETTLNLEDEDPLWNFLFNSEWGYYAEDANATQKDFALLRMDYVLKHGEQPEGWYYSMSYDELKNLSPKDLVKKRMDKYAKMGVFKG